MDYNLSLVYNIIKVNKLKVIMKRKLYPIIFVLFFVVGNIAHADMPSFASDMNQQFPWYAYFLLGVFLIVVISFSFLLLAKIKYRKQDISKNHPRFSRLVFGLSVIFYTCFIISLIYIFLGILQPYFSLLSF